MLSLADPQILAILLLEIIVTLRGYGGGMSTWRTPFNELITNGTTKTGRGVEHHSEAGLGASSAGVPVGMTSTGPQVVQRV